ncbi:trichohyalin-like [Plakobranchus ocellatus]|uniref:Trichohyalin-like n=1 Tax=Plakobranchus ocellatus TaxID=259542 RepID=A0AAV3Z0Z9_9GAST|nr:trichohyalin-like [Plakobranchus ocellatus]
MSRYFGAGDDGNDHAKDDDNDKGDDGTDNGSSDHLNSNTSSSLSYLKDNKDLERKEEEERQEHIEHSVKRKLHKWHTHGLAAMLEDHDGMGHDGDMTDDMMVTSDKDSIKTGDVLTLLEAKYSTLQDRVLMELASRVASMDSEKLEIFNKVKKMLSKARKNRLQDEDLSQMLEKTALPVTLLGLLGDLADAEKGRRQEFETLGKELLEQGKSEPDVDNHLRGVYNQIVQGEQTCDVVLDQLDMRLKAEREAVLSALHNQQRQQDGLSSTQALHLHYCCLLRQLHLLQEEDHMTLAGLAVGLAERAQVYKPQRYDWDRDRSEQLASRRLEVRVGRRQVKRSTANIDLDTLERVGPVELRTRLVEELEQAQFLEREAMVQFLQGSEAQTYQEAVSGLSLETRQKKIRNLRSRRQECLSLSNWATNQKLLAEATALYREERRAEIEQMSANVREDTVAAVVLADLQQRQEVEAQRILLENLTKNTRELTKTVLTLIEARNDELFPNIAFVTLGHLEVSAEDQDFLVTLEAKFKAMRDQVFVFGLTERLGSGWKSMAKEEKQKEILQQRKEEKRLRGESKFGEMEQLIGPRSQALPNLRHLMGEDKAFPNVPSKQQIQESGKNINLLADLATRFDVEQESLLSWLQLPEVKALSSRVKHIQLTRLAAEKFVASAEVGHETALLGVGLLERVGEYR